MYFSPMCCAYIGNNDSPMPDAQYRDADEPGKLKYMYWALPETHGGGALASIRLL